MRVKPVDRCCDGVSSIVNNNNNGKEPLSTRTISFDKRQQAKISAMTARDAERGQWNSQLQFTLTCIGYAVGLGNIWRFPKLAYENGGVAFLIPYVCCSTVIGFPLLYLELCLGQFTSSGSVRAFFRILPIMQGLGIAMTVLSMLIGIYYNVIVAWILNYLFSVITAQSWRWSRCLHENVCQSDYNDRLCLPDKFYNFTCYPEGQWLNLTGRHSADLTSATEEYFRNYILEQSPSMDQLNGLNWKLVIGLFVAWTIVGAALIRGVKWLGRISLFTATFPYLVVLILFIRAVTLDGAGTGLGYYLLQPDWSTLLKTKTWREAATQVSYSLSIGFGGLLTLASYNPRNHFCFKDAIIVTLADSFMSFFNGMAVFSVLGFMAKQLNKPITEVIREGEGLAFIAYPEAMGRMPLQWLWAFLFFFMLGMLGFTSMFGFVEVLNSAIMDQFPKAHRRRTLITTVICFLMFVAGLIMCTKAGLYYFQVFNHYTASISLMVVIFLETVVIAHIYGAPKFIADLRSMFGQPKNAFTNFFGPSGWYFAGIWLIVSPLFTMVMIILTVMDQLNASLEYGRTLGWCLSLLPIGFIPIYAIKNLLNYKIKNKPLQNLFRPHYTWPSDGKHINRIAAIDCKPKPDRRPESNAF